MWVLTPTLLFKAKLGEKGVREMENPSIPRWRAQNLNEFCLKFILAPNPIFSQKN